MRAKYRVNGRRSGRRRAIPLAAAGVAVVSQGALATIIHVDPDDFTIGPASAGNAGGTNNEATFNFSALVNSNAPANSDFRLAHNPAGTSGNPQLRFEGLNHAAEAVVNPLGFNDEVGGDPDDSHRGSAGLDRVGRLLRDHAGGHPFGTSPRHRMHRSKHCGARPHLSQGWCAA